MVFFYTPSLRYHLRFDADTTPSLLTMNPEELQLMFAARLDLFDPILGHPTGADLTRLSEELTTIIIPLYYDVEKGNHNLLGIMMDEGDYNQRYCAKFPTPTKPSVYGETIPDNATNVACAKPEAAHKANIADCQLFASAKHETRDFILAVVDDKWVHKLCDPVTFYTAVLSLELLDHLKTLCGGLHALDVLMLQN